jgi:hypothetical protein
VHFGPQADRTIRAQAPLYGGGRRCSGNHGHRRLCTPEDRQNEKTPALTA